jgi:hypothetical protein
LKSQIKSKSAVDTTAGVGSLRIMITPSFRFVIYGQHWNGFNAFTNILQMLLEHERKPMPVSCNQLGFHQAKNLLMSKSGRIINVW